MSTPTAAFRRPLVGYLAGSTLPAHILARRRGLDFRVIGKNPGTAETFRHFGFWPAVLVYVLDATKALLPLIAGNLLRVPGWSLVLTAAAAVAGHHWSLYYRFWGGARGCAAPAPPPGIRAAGSPTAAAARSGRAACAARPGWYCPRRRCPHQ